MQEYLTFLMGVFPLFVMIVLILKLKTPIHYAVIITLILTLLVAVFMQHTPLLTLGSICTWIWCRQRSVADCYRHPWGDLQLQPDAEDRQHERAARYFGQY